MLLLLWLMIRFIVFHKFNVYKKIYSCTKVKNAHYFNYLIKYTNSPKIFIKFSWNHPQCSDIKLGIKAKLIAENSEIIQSCISSFSLFLLLLPFIFPATFKAILFSLTLQLPNSCLVKLWSLTRCFLRKYWTHHSRPTFKRMKLGKMTEE